MIVLAGAGEHFCAGHDIGSPGRDVDVSFDRQAVLWWDHVGRDGADAGTPGRWRSTWACAAAGGRCPSPSVPTTLAICMRMPYN